MTHVTCAAKFACKWLIRKQKDVISNGTSQGRDKTLAGLNLIKNKALAC
jgi:hypothetical protein